MQISRVIEEFRGTPHDTGDSAYKWMNLAGDRRADSTTPVAKALRISSAINSLLIVLFFVSDKFCIYAAHLLAA